MVSKRMKTTPAMACLKTLLTIFSLIFVAIGCAILGFGAYARIKLLSYINLSTIDYSNAPWAMIAIGSFIIIVGIIGCCATIKGNTCLLRTYGFLLALVFICELGGAIVAIVFRGKIDEGFKDGMEKAIINYSTKSNKDAVDNVQKNLHCCGAVNYTDFWTLTGATFNANTVPVSCCASANCTSSASGNVVKVTGDPNGYIYTQGCHSIVFGIVNDNLGIIIGVMFGVAFFQVIGILLACCLASNINSNKYELV